MPELKKDEKKDEKTQKDTKNINTADTNTTEKQNSVSTATNGDTVLTAPPGCLLFYDKDKVPYTNESIIQGIVKHSTIVMGYGGFDFEGGGIISAGGTWPQMVQKMGKWYEANIHTYQGTTYKKPQCAKSWFKGPLGYNVGDDCSGYVCACLHGIGAMSTGTHWSSSSFTTDSSVEEQLKKAGFVKIPWSFESRRPYDIQTKCGHVEIYAGVDANGSHRSWGWGWIHDTSHGGMPAKIDRTKYTYIFRKTS